MNNRTLLIAATTSLLLSGTALGQNRPADCKPDAPRQVEGKVIAVNASEGKLTLQADDGTRHEFRASGETIGSYKAGDPIKARLRSSQRCD